MYRGDHRKFAAVVVLLTAVVLLTGGCLRSSRPTRVFVLQAETLSPLPETVFPTQFFVAAVNLPDYLKRWQIIRRKDNFEIVIDWFSSWNELPELAVPAVIEHNLRDLLGGNQVVAQDESKRGMLGLSFDFSTFAGDDNGAFKVVGVCRQGRRTVADFNFAMPYQTARIEELVAAHARALAEVSRITAENLCRSVNEELSAP